jgi:hypothetical protein
VNYGFENFWLLSFQARGKYFMFVNDRDFIKPHDINLLCDTLEKLEDCDFISNEKKNYPIGYYEWKDALDIYFQSRHPGTLIYNRQFCGRVLEESVLRNYLAEQHQEKANNYLVFQLLLNVEKVYVFRANVINQPRNRERIPQVRKEYYNCPYISAEYRMREYDDWIKKGKLHLSNPRTRYIMLAIFKDSLMTVTWEYYMSMKIPGFPKRARYTDHRPGEWILNGSRFTGHILTNPDFHTFSLNKEIWKASISNFTQTLHKVSESI